MKKKNMPELTKLPNWKADRYTIGHLIHGVRIRTSSVHCQPGYVLLPHL